MARTVDQIFQQSYGYTDAEMLEINERQRVRAAERAEDRGMRRSPWVGRVSINPHSTMSYHLQGISRPTRMS